MSERPRFESDTLKIIDDGDNYEAVFEIDIISATANPETKEFKCIACDDGVVTYGRGHLESSNGSRIIKVNSIEAYRCDSCDFSALLKPVEAELREIITRLELQK